jgi:predicted  nucleic acid-binding Zn-ribbon protein
MDLDALRAENAALSQQVHSLKLEAQGQETHHKALEWEVSSLRKKVKSAEEQIGTIRATALAEAEGKMQLSTSKERRGWGEEREGRLRAAAATADRVRKETEALQDAVSQAKKEAADARIERDEVEARLQGELAALMDTGPLNTSREEVSTLGERLRASGKEKEVLERNIRGLKVELAREREEGGGAKKEVKGLHESLVAGSRERAALQAALEVARQRALDAETTASEKVQAIQGVYLTTRASLEACEAREQALATALEAVQGELRGVQDELRACKEESALALETSLNSSLQAAHEMEGTLASSRASAEARVVELERVRVEREGKLVRVWGVGSLLLGVVAGGGIGYGLAAHLAAKAARAARS